MNWNDQPQNTLEAVDQRDLCLHLLRSLPSHHRRIAILYWMCGATQGEIGDVYGQTRNNITGMIQNELLPLLRDNAAKQVGD